MEIEDRELEHSPFSGRVTEDGITVKVLIYRFAESNERWQLEVVDHEGGSTVWDELFATDQDAYRAFYLVLKSDGIRSFLEGGSLLH